MSGQVYPVVLCGGSGTRLWPLSREAYPKQFSPLFDGGTLFQRTVERVTGLGHAPPIVLTNEAFRFVVAEQLDAIGAKATRIVVEPARRNTGPAVAAAARLVEAIDPDGILMVLPSDHLIADPAAFRGAAERAVAAARAGHLVTFGIRPDRPETGYGYIELTADAGTGAQPFRRFIEKPDLETAEKMVASDRFLWNSGMFVLGVRPVLAAFAAHAPEIDDAAAEAVADGREDLFFFRLGTAAYERAAAISIDYAIMEHVAGQVVPVDCGWNDLGSWETVWQESTRDAAGVAAGARTLAIDCRETLLRADHPNVRVVGLGLERVAVVATGDAVLVAGLDRTQDVRLAVERLAADGAAQATEFPRSYRPWGWYEALASGTRFQVKQIMVKPGGRLSLQSHVHRSEHWVVVAGTAKVTVGDETRLLAENESVYVPLGAVHRLENPGRLDLHLIEVQSGPYLDEDDIVRYEDVYARD